MILEDFMELGKKLIEIRRDNKMTQEDFAEKFCVTHQTVSNWENGKTYPDLETLVCISDEFDVSFHTWKTIVIHMSVVIIP